VVLFPVRHHSPAAARLVRDLVHTGAFETLLVEGPPEFNERLGELTAPHTPPIAIYTYAATADSPDTPPERLGAYYPFCDYSPEWQAVRAGLARHMAVAFIDRPWVDLASRTLPENRYSDHQLRSSQYLEVLARKLGVESFDDVWDTLIEQHPDLSLTDYLERCHTLCTHLRLLGGPVSFSDEYREARMTEQLVEALKSTAGRILVVTGGYHSWGIAERLQGRGMVLPDLPARATAYAGVALTPYSFARLDSLTGYNSGMPNPGFYQLLWETPGPAPDLTTPLLKQLTTALRARQQTISTADVIATEITARTLANIRGHRHVWRTDIVDGLMAAVLKDDQIPGQLHPVLAAVRECLRGSARGQLAAGTTRPPLVDDALTLLKEHDLKIDPPRQLELSLADTGGRTRSTILHRLRILGIAGIHGTTEPVEDPILDPVEIWRLAWVPEFEANLIEASRYGATLEEATGQKLLESARAATGNAQASTAVLWEAALAGLPRFAPEFLHSLVDCLRTEPQFTRSGVA
ncbi:MAG: DUF5682 family protein, partial [Gemmataceae bacterium]